MLTELERAWWFVLPEERPCGPVPGSEIERALADGTLPPSLLVSSVNDAEWVPAADVSRFRTAIELASGGPSSADVTLQRYDREDEIPTNPGVRVASSKEDSRLAAWPLAPHRLVRRG